MIELVQVKKVFANHTAVDNISLKIESGEFLTLLGPSGCGKTTTLRMIAGFEQPDSGSIFINNTDVAGKPPYQRPVNTVFQNYALFPHMTIAENIAFGLRLKKMATDQISARVKEALRMVRLEGYEKRMPSQLSGGQKQRVAIARALVNDPEVLLLDEPLGALDLKLRQQMQMELKQLQRKLGITFILVTHDQEEALHMSDRIAVMNQGRVEQLGTPREIYDFPQTEFVADFVGETNFFRGQVQLSGKTPFLKLGEFSLPLEEDNYRNNEEVTMAIRPERLKIVPASDNLFAFIPGQVKEKIYCGSDVKSIFVLPGGQQVTVVEPSSRVSNLEASGEAAFLTWDYHNVVVIRKNQ